MRVLIVDDQTSQRTMLRHLIEDIGAEIKVTDFADPVHALLWTQKEPPDLVILDYRMPKMDGLEFARRFRRPLAQRDVPMMLVTVVGDEPLRQAALDAGIIDFLVKPIRPRELRARCKNMLDLRQRQQSLKSRTHLLEHQLMSGTHQMEQRERDLLTRLVRVAVQREGASVRSAERISRFSGLLADAAGMSECEARMVEHAATLHDIGNIGIPDVVLNKPGPLNDAERTLMQQHTVLGHEILRNSESSYIQVGADIALNHHERWDGGGYPRGLFGDFIPLPARIVAVADVLDALTTPRPYRETWSMRQALDHAYMQAGLHFDPELVKVLRAREDAFVEADKAYECQ
jgi:two-component system response regulator RpfG